MKAVLIDDESIALELLRKELQSVGGVEVIGSYTNPFEGIEQIKKLRPDIAFLDIEMGGINGLKVAEIIMEIYNDIEIVFITAYSQYAIEAFEVNAIDYLVKPIQKSRLDKTIRRIEKKIGETKKTYAVDGLSVTCFGTFRVKDCFGNSLKWRTRKAKELFAFLWYQNGKAISKAIIMDTIFPDKNMEEATAILHTTIYQLRVLLKRSGYGNNISYLNDSYRLKIDSMSDYSELKGILNKTIHSKEEIKRIIEIYKHDFLEEEGYHWAIGVQFNIREKVFKSIKKYVTDSLNNRMQTLTLDSCLFLLRKIEPYDEKVAEMFIIYYGELNRRSDIKAFFDSYTEGLWDEMKLKPGKNITNLYYKYMNT